MIRFSTDDPFPLLPEGSHSYAEAQEHSAEVDSYLGLRTEQIENEILQSTREADRPAPAPVQEWIGLPVKALLTPYTEIREILNRLDLQPGMTVIDLGAGYGRMGHVIGRHYPGVHFIGYESVEARVEEAARSITGQDFANRVRMVLADLSAPEFQPEAAQYYFLYDFGSAGAIEKTLEDLRRIARSSGITVIGRGRASRDAIEHRHPWLGSVNSPKHFPHYSIYRS